jgi:broad specificity phosphatase PhoE
MHLILVRHGETAWSRTGQHTGTTDLELLDEGRAQAISIAPLIRKTLAGSKPQAVFTSPLRRAVETARLADPGLPAIRSEWLRECIYGAYEGLSPTQIRDLRPGWDFWRDGCLDGENAAEVGARADNFLAECVSGDEPIIAFSHGHMIRILAARALGLPAEQGQLFTLGTASVSEIKDVRGKRVISLWNLTPGLA